MMTTENWPFKQNHRTTRKCAVILACVYRSALTHLNPNIDLDFMPRACRGLYFSMDFCVDSSSSFPFNVQSDRETDRQTDKVTHNATSKPLAIEPVWMIRSKWYRAG